MLFCAPADKEVAEIVEIDTHRTEHIRRIWPFLRDRRIDAYGDLTKRFRD
jgi:N-carbamoylputrescine amidase